MDKKRVSYLALSENGFLFDSATGHTYSLNDTGAFILKGLIEGETLDDIAAAMADAYDASPETISRDLDQFIHFVEDLDLINPR